MTQLSTHSNQAAQEEPFNTIEYTNNFIILCLYV